MGLKKPKRRTKMKKLILAVFVFGLFLAACAGKGAVKGEIAKIDTGVERAIIDYKGAGLGEARPQWVSAAVNDDYAQLEAMPRLKDKLAVIAIERGKNLDLLKSWANNFSIQSQLSRQISNKIRAEFGGGQGGDKNSTEEAASFGRDVAATLSKTTISGLAKEVDYWVKMRVTDKTKKTVEEYYEYYVVYSISRANLEYQIDVALGKIQAKDQKQSEIKAEVKDAIKRLRASDLVESEIQ
jgi:hypothetical protein